jgi:hypothetical protein
MNRSPTSLNRSLLLSTSSPYFFDSKRAAMNRSGAATDSSSTVIDRILLATDRSRTAIDRLLLFFDCQLLFLGGSRLLSVHRERQASESRGLSNGYGRRWKRNAARRSEDQKLVMAPAF